MEPELCPDCGVDVYWHRVYKTRAGVRAFCRYEAHRAECLGPAAVDVWERLHIAEAGEQLELLDPETLSRTS